MNIDTLLTRVAGAGATTSVSSGLREHVVDLLSVFLFSIINNMLNGFQKSLRVLTAFEHMAFQEQIFTIARAKDPQHLFFERN